MPVQNNIFIMEAFALSKNKISSKNTNTDTAPEKAPKFPYLFRRLMEILIISIIVSLPLEALRFYKAASSIAWGMRLTFLSIFLFIILNIYVNRVFFYSMGNKKIYFRVNIIAYTLFAALNVAGLYMPAALYNFIFMPFDYISYLFFDVIKPDSGHEIFRGYAAAITHAIMYLLIFISPGRMYAIEKRLVKRRK